MNLVPMTLVLAPTRLILLGLLAFLVIAPIGLAAQTGAPQSGNWTGILVSASCTQEDISRDVAACFTGAPGERPSLYDDTNGVLYALAPRQAVGIRLGEVVTVSGTLVGATIQGASVDLLPLGLAIGQKAPDFSIPDQFGKLQTLESLRGPRGTV